MKCPRNQQTELERPRQQISFEERKLNLTCTQLHLAIFSPLLFKVALNCFLFLTLKNWIEKSIAAVQHSLRAAVALYVYVSVCAFVCVLSSSSVVSGEVGRRYNDHDDYLL